MIEFNIIRIFVMIFNLVFWASQKQNNQFVINIRPIKQEEGVLWLYAIFSHSLYILCFVKVYVTRMW